MYISKLTANKESFNTIHFFSNDLNIILGSKGENGNSSTNETVNGVGKTLSIKLIDYCLGSRQDAHKEISKLSGWEFELLLVDDNRNYQIRRYADTGKVCLNNKDMNLSQFNDTLAIEFFKHTEEYQYVSFRNLISRYLRIPKHAYLSWEKYKAKEDDFKSLLLNAFLLGLELDLIIKKINFKEEINKIDKSKSYLQNDSTIKGIMNGADVNIGMNNLVKEIQTLEEQLSNFKISEGYNDVKKEIEESKFLKNDIINQGAKFSNIISSINENLDIKLDITNKKVEELYMESQVLFPKEMIKNLEEITLFHKKLIEGRKLRLIKDKLLYMSKREKLENKLKLLDNKINYDMEFIKDKVSTTEYERLQNRLVELKIQFEKMQQYGRVLKEFEYKKADIQANMARDNVASIKYIDEINDYKTELSVQFQKYVDFIYGENKYSGIDIVNNPGANKLRFDINVFIQDDGSGGIGNVKLFCMDLILWERKINSSIEFLYHDGVLFSEVDPRQCYKMLKLAYQICQKNKLEYIFNMNYDMYDNIKEVALNVGDKEFEKHLDDCIRMRLKDDSPKHKLLGIQIK